ncbi:MAG: 4a-hydroxytetrahydrobiopterin dehydratase [Actinobacteria bacterium]|nr:4a-hydroxytetrahydrobiopterin dehydratase [Actinomycetota bacterium]
MDAVPDGKLSDLDIDTGLSGLSTWRREGDAIRRSYQLPSFADAIAFVVRVGFLAEAKNHHPDLDVRWRTVHVTLTTHDAGGITAKDLDLAREIEAAAPEASR